MSIARSAYVRMDGDRYYTPGWVTEALLSVETFEGGVWDPAAGAGHILAALPTAIPTNGTDIAPDGAGIREADFLQVKVPGRWANIVTNPPYGVQSRLAVQFIEQALRLTRPHGGKVAMLLKVGFDSASGRRHLFADHPAFAAEHVLTRRIRWANLEQKASGPTENHSWFVWDWRKRGGMPAKSYIPFLPKEHVDA